MLAMDVNDDAGCLEVRVAPCRSELAREGLKDAALIQTAHVIVEVHRRNAARSKLAPTRWLLPFAFSVAARIRWRSGPSLPELPVCEWLLHGG